MRHLRSIGHVPIGPVASYVRAVQLVEEQRVDLALIDVNLDGARNGIAVARWLSERTPPIAHAYLSSEEDPEMLEAARTTGPIAHLFKPIRPESFRLSIDTVLQNFAARPGREQTVTVTDGRVTLVISASLVLYLQTEHVYVRVVTRNHPPLVCRQSLQQLLEALDSQLLLQTHRSYAVNVTAISSLADTYVALGRHQIPLSRRRRREVMDRVKGMM